jgi:hypothetical protein
MKSGASAAKREAKRQAQAAYFEALTKAEKLQNIKTIDSNSARKLEDELGDDYSYGTKRLAMQADKVAKKINQDETMQEGIGKFNKRYDEIRRQMNGERITKFKVKEKSQEIGIGSVGLVNSNTIGSGLDTFDNYDSAKESIKNQNDTKQITANRNFGAGLFNTSSNNQTSSSVEEVSLNSINSNYRSLPQTRGAFNDLKSLSENLSKNPVNQYAQSYEAIAQKIKGRLNRKLADSAKINLNSPDVLSGAPVQDVIK